MGLREKLNQTAHGWMDEAESLLQDAADDALLGKARAAASKIVRAVAMQSCAEEVFLALAADDEATPGG